VLREVEHDRDEGEAAKEEDDRVCLPAHVWLAELLRPVMNFG
jgi:hypothetical protein